jgi:hypothetical protein
LSHGGPGGLDGFGPGAGIQFLETRLDQLFLRPRQIPLDDQRGDAKLDQRRAFANILTLMEKQLFHPSVHLRRQSRGGPSLHGSGVFKRGLSRDFPGFGHPHRNYTILLLGVNRGGGNGHSDCKDAY